MFKKMDIKKILKESVLYAVIIFLAMNIISYIRSPSLKDNSLKAITSTLIDGSKFSIQNNKMQKPLLVHFWATWCPTCKLEADNIQRISEYFNIISVAVKSGTNQEIKNFMQKHHYTFKVINDNDGKLASRFMVPAYPTTFIYNSRGEIEFSEVGYSSYWGLYLRLLWAER